MSNGSVYEPEDLRVGPIRVFLMTGAAAVREDLGEFRLRVRRAGADGRQAAVEDHRLDAGVDEVAFIEDAPRAR